MQNHSTSNTPYYIQHPVGIIISQAYPGIPNNSRGGDYNTYKVYEKAEEAGTREARYSGKSEKERERDAED